MQQNNVTIDKIKWFIWTDKNGVRYPQPLCPIHHLRLEGIRNYGESYLHENTCIKLKCEECTDPFSLPRTFDKEKQYIINKIDAKAFSTIKFVNLDDEALPIAENKIPKNSEYFITSLLTKSKVGLRLIVYAGKRGGAKKTQIFVEPDIKRLAFDQKDLHPTDVFTMVEAIFEDGTKSKIESKT